MFKKRLGKYKINLLLINWMLKAYKGELGKEMSFTIMSQNIKIDLGYQLEYCQEILFDLISSKVLTSTNNMSCILNNSSPHVSAHISAFVVDLTTPKKSI